MAYRNDAGFFFRTFEKIANPGVKIMAEWTEEAKKKKNGIKKKKEKKINCQAQRDKTELSQKQYCKSFYGFL